TKDPARAARIELLIGLASEELADWPAAAQHLAAADAALPQLADYVGYHAARAAYNAHAPGALERAQKVARDSIVGADAEILVGDCLRDRADWPAVIAFYKDYLARHPDGPFRSEARFDLADAMEQAKEPRAELVKLYRQIEIDDPLASWNDKAHARLVALKAVPENFTAAEHIAQGKVLFDNQRNPESEKAFDEALADPKIAPADRCVAAYHRAESRFKARDRKGAAPMFDEAVTACHAA